jgi:hypothetical protein
MSMKRVFRYANPLGIWRYLTVGIRMARRVGAAHGVSWKRIVREQLVLNYRNDLRRDEYFRYNLFRRDMPWQEKLCFLSDKRNRTIWANLNPSAYVYLTKNKLALHALYSGAGLPVPKLLGVFDPGCVWRTGVSGLRSEADLDAWMRDPGHEQSVFKPIEGCQGLMVVVFNGRDPADAGRLMSVAGKSYGARELIAHMTDPLKLKAAYDGGAPKAAFLIQDRIRQHPVLEPICGQTVCSVRVVTLVDGDAVSVLEAVFKLSPSGSGIDNLHAGGLAVGINRETGRLSKGKTLKDLAGPYVGALRDGRVFEGVVLPFWREVQELATEAARVFPYTRCLGWDIAIGESGPVLIEGNWGWGADVLQLGSQRGMWRGRLKSLS